MTKVNNHTAYHNFLLVKKGESAGSTIPKGELHKTLTQQWKHMSKQEREHFSKSKPSHHHHTIVTALRVVVPPTSCCDAKQNRLTVHQTVHLTNLKMLREQRLRTQRIPSPPLQLRRIRQRAPRQVKRHPPCPVPLSEVRALRVLVPTSCDAKPNPHLTVHQPKHPTHQFENVV